MAENELNASLSNRILILVYGLVCYLVGVAGLVAIIAALATLLPFGFLIGAPGAHPVVWNVVLVAIWGLIHTAMARGAFKERLTRIVPEPAERATYVLVAGITSIRFRTTVSLCSCGG